MSRRWRPDWPGGSTLASGGGKTEAGDNVPEDCGDDSTQCTWCPYSHPTAEWGLLTEYSEKGQGEDGIWGLLDAL